MRFLAFPLLLLAALAAGMPHPASSAEKPALIRLSGHERSLLAEAFRLADKRRWPEAERYAARLSDPVAAKIVVWRRLNQGVSAIGFAEYAAFLENNPDWPRPEALRVHAEKAMDDNLSEADAVSWFTKYPPLTEEGRLRLINALLARGHAEKAGEWVRYTWRNDRLSRNLWRRFYNKHRRLLRQEDNWVRADNLLWQEHRTEAQGMLQLLPRADRALAAARLALQTRSSGVDAYVARVPRSLRNDPGLVYERLRWRRRHGLDERAAELLLSVPGELGPMPERWWLERRRQARDLFEAGEIRSAYRMVAEHGQAAGTLGHAEAEWFAGWLALRFLNETAAAAEHFQRLFDGVSFPISRARGAYWRARALSAMGEAQLAERWYRIAARYPTTYYGQLALEALNTERELHLRPAVVPQPEQWAGFRRREIGRAVLILAEMEQWITLKTFITHLAEQARLPIEYSMLADIATRYRRYDLAVHVSKISVRGDHPVVEYGYPIFRLPEIDPEPALVFAIMRQESEFSTTVVSRAGALGLMQVMPGTAREMAGTIGVGFNRGRLLADPEYNVRLGSAYIVTMLEEFNGSYVLAVAAYNAGPSRVREWIERFGDPRDPGVDAIDWVESIPFSETRNYVQRVLEALQVYRHRLAERPTQSRLTMDLTGAGSGLDGAVHATP